jgi:hypothetical protein
MRARTLTRLFPRHWRERYGDEYAALLEARPITIADAASTAGLAAREWLKTGWAVVPIACVISEGAVLGGRALARLGEPPEWLAVGAIVAVAVVSLCDWWRCATGRLSSVRKQSVRDPRPLTDHTVTYLMAAIFVAGLAMEWFQAAGGGLGKIYANLGLADLYFLISPVFLASVTVQSWSSTAADRQARLGQRVRDLRERPLAHPMGLQ